MNFKNIRDAATMKAAAALLHEAATVEGGMEALAAAVAAPIQLEIERRNIVPLVLTQHDLAAGESAKYQKVKGLTAHYIAVGGQPRREEVNADSEVEFPVFRVHSTPEIDISDLKHGNVGKLADLQTAAARAIRKQLNAKVAILLSAAATGTNIVTVSGGKLTDTAFYEAVGKIEDLELTPRLVLLRGQRMIDLKGWTLDEEGKKEFREKGVLKALGGAGLINSASMATDEVVLVPDEEIGKYAIRTPVAVDPQKKGFKVGFLTWHECAMGITRPDLVFKVKINS